MLTRRQALIVGAAGIGTFLRGTGRAYAAALQAAPPVNLAAAQPSTPVKFSVPRGACDTHVHVFGDQQRYPFAPTAGYRHGPATPDDLSAMHKALHVDRVVIVQPSVYGTDNRCILDGVAKVGSTARAVVAIDEKTTDKELDEMDRRGARGIRVGIGQTIPEARKQLEAAGRRLSGRKWHINTAPRLSMLEGLQDQVMAMPVPLVLDHWVYATASGGVSQPGLDVLLKLLQAGKVYVKITHNLDSLAVKASEFPGTEVPLAKALIAANPQRIIWGTDWPHVGRLPGYSATDISPYRHLDDGLLFNHVAIWVPDVTQRRTILVENPARLYGF